MTAEARTDAAELYSLIEAASPGPYCELFARQTRIGWDAPDLPKVTITPVPEGAYSWPPQS